MFNRCGQGEAGAEKRMCMEKSSVVKEFLCRNKRDILLAIGIILIVAIVVGVYVYCFKMVFHADISTKTSDWGSFGGYFGGMISIISIVLLYYTFTEQRRANYRNSFDNAYKRLLESYMVNIKDNKNYFDNVFEGICLNAKQAVSVLSAESTPWEKLN